MFIQFNAVNFGRGKNISRHANSSESHKTSCAISHNYQNFNCVVDVEKENQSYPCLTKRQTENI